MQSCVWRHSKGHVFFCNYQKYYKRTQTFPLNLMEHKWQNSSIRKYEGQSGTCFYKSPTEEACKLNSILYSRGCIVFKFHTFIRSLLLGRHYARY